MLVWGSIVQIVRGAVAQACAGAQNFTMTPSPVRALDVEMERLPNGQWRGRNRVSGEVFIANEADDVLRWLSRRVGTAA